MLEEFLGREEGKTLEFKENTGPLIRLLQTITAFANTAGGVLIIGVRDKTKEVVGLSDILKDELRVANAIADTITPILLPNIQLHTWRGRDVLIISVSHSIGPYYIESEGIVKGTYIRLGSTNRPGGSEVIEEIQRLSTNTTFDLTPRPESHLSEINFDLAEAMFAKANKPWKKHTAASLGVTVSYQDRQVPSNAGILLFGRDRRRYFPDSLVRLATFKGETKRTIVDQLDIDTPLVTSLDEALAFIRRSTTLRSDFVGIRRADIPQYPPFVVREIVMNALVHSDYAMGGSSIMIAIFSDRIEVTSPGGLPFGLQLESALAGYSKLRNRVIGRVFHELGLTEQWGSGLTRIQEILAEEKRPLAIFEEPGRFFRVTIPSNGTVLTIDEPWQQLVMEHLAKRKSLSPKEAQEIWEVTPRTAYNRLKKMVSLGIITEVSTSRFDPHKTYISRLP